MGVSPRRYKSNTNQSQESQEMQIEELKKEIQVFKGNREEQMFK